MNKKILIGAGIVTLIILIGGLFFVFSGNGGDSGEGFWNSLPFGNSGSETVTPPQTNSGTVDQIVLTETAPTITKENELKKIGGAPVSGAIFLKSATSSEHGVRFIERATGHIYDANLETDSIIRISNTTIPKIEVVAWGIDGKSFLAQTVDSGIIKSKIYEIALPTGTSTSEAFARIDEFPLQDNIFSPSISAGNQVFYLAQGMRGIEGFVANLRGENPRIVWQFPTTEWVSEWAGNGTLALTSKSSFGIDGALYILNTSNNNTSLRLSGIASLTTKTSPMGNKILFSSSEKGPLTLDIVESATDNSTQVPFQTLPEKCVWTENETTLYCFQPRQISQNLPDTWYQGLVSFNDRLWKMNMATGETEIVSELQTLSGEYIDAINPLTSSDGKYVVFTNKKDLTLWAVSTEN